MSTEEDTAARLARAMRHYQRDAMARHSYKRRAFSVCSVEHKKLLLDVGFADYLESILNCVQANQEVLNVMLEGVGLDEEEDEGNEGEPKETRTLHDDHTRIEEMFGRIVREWSKEGRNSRDACFGTILKDLEELFPDDGRADTKIIFPSCCLARLPFEAALRGFDCLAADPATLSLLAANFVLNRCERVNNYRIYPRAHDLTNRARAGDAAAPVAFPDVDPTARADDGEGELRLNVINGENK